jgi:ribosome-associated protein
VNKTSSRITVRWNVPATTALTEEQKERVLAKLAHALTSTGDLIIHYGASRSQHQNKEEALKHLAQEIRNALKVPKKRKKTRIPAGVKEARLKEKRAASALKKTRRMPPE